MLRRIYTSTPSSLRRASKTVRSLPKLQRRSLIPAPTQRSGPLLERRADRELPPLPPSAASRWLKTLPLFVTAIGLSALAIFNYQKTSSSVVNSTLYSLRTNPEARAILGDEIYFRDRFPWIWGELNQLHGKIDIGFWVKGNNGSGYMRFRSVRRARMGYFETIEWSLEKEDGSVVHLLDHTQDPFQNNTVQAASKERKS